MNINADILFTWRPSAGATNYELQVSTDSTFSVVAQVDSGLSRYEVHLVEMDLFKSYNLKNTEHVSIPPYNKIKNYSVLIGTKSFVMAILP